MESRTNPWEEDQTHPYDSILKYCNIPSDIMPHERELLQKLEEDPLMVAVKTIRAADDLESKISSVKQRCRTLTWMNRAPEVLRSEELNAKLQSVELLLESFQSCVTELPKLQRQLCQPFQGSSLKIESEHHDSILQLFSDTVLMLDRFQSILDTLDWHRKKSYNDAAKKEVLDKLKAAERELKQNWVIVEKSMSLLMEKYGRMSALD